MKITYQTLSLIFLLAILSLGTISSQDTDALVDYKFSRLYPAISLTNAELTNVEDIVDINDHFKPSWVRKYLSIEIKTIHDGVAVSSYSTTDQLTNEQKKALQSTDIGSEINVLINYMPENTLKHNDPQIIDFSFVVEPDQDAYYKSGEERLYEYIEEELIHDIPKERFQGFDMTAIKFVINEEGRVTNSEIIGAEYQSEGFEDINNLLHKAIANMPTWVPAQYDNGRTTKQEFVLLVGNQENCWIYTLNLNKGNF